MSERFDERLDRLLDAFGAVRTSDDARDAIHAHVAQREREKDAEIARMREALRWIADTTMDPRIENCAEAALASPPPATEETLDGLLAKRDEACYRHEVAEASAAIRAYVAQREREKDAEIARMKRIVEDLVNEDDDCHFDHHGYCQAHGWLVSPKEDDGNPDAECPQARAKRALGWDTVPSPAPIPIDVANAALDVARLLGVGPSQVHILGLRPEDA